MRQIEKRRLAAALAVVMALAAAPAAYAAGGDEVVMQKDGKTVTAERLRPVVAPDFADATEIEHWDAVSMLATWGVIAGKDSGAFDPAAPVTRAEMAKLVCAMHFGGHDLRSEPDPNYTFADTQGHWAERYISFCAEREIIQGRGDGTFDPDASVTGAEAAKMLLILLNYRDDIFGLTGEKWHERTMQAAGGAGLFQGLGTFQADEALSRDDAAQMLYNTLYAHPMIREEVTDPDTGEFITYKYSTGDTDDLGGTFMVKAFGGSLGPGPDQPKAK